MSQISKSSLPSIVIVATLGLLIAKSLWVAVETLYLPNKGIDVEDSSGIKPLFYKYNLASKKDKPKKIVKKSTNRVVAPIAKSKPEEIKKFTLKGIYSSSSKKIAMIDYKDKSYMLMLKEELEGYKLSSVHAKDVIMTKSGKEYKLELYSPENANATDSKSKRTPSPQPLSNKKKLTPKKAAEPKLEGGTTVIPKDLFNKYKSDYGEIRSSINAIPNMDKGKLNGFKISFVKANSDFSKLGLKRGDVITAINGEPLNNFKVPLEFFNNIDSVTAATLTIKRGNETKELEYEVR